jgi:hypothetical protein
VTRSGRHLRYDHTLILQEREQFWVALINSGMA